MGRQGRRHIFVLVDIKLLLVLEHLLEERRHGTAAEVDQFILQLLRLVPPHLLFPVVLVGTQGLLLLQSAQ